MDMTMDCWSKYERPWLAMMLQRPGTCRHAADVWCRTWKCVQVVGISGGLSTR